MDNFQDIDCGTDKVKTEFTSKNWRIFFLLRHPDDGYYIQWRKSKSTPWSRHWGGDPDPNTVIFANAETLEEAIILLAEKIKEGLKVAKSMEAK